MSQRPRRRRLASLLLGGQSDARLVALVREGRESAFEEIVRRYRAGLVAFAAAYAPPDRAEDVVQESFLRAWDALRASTGEIRLRPWLYTIVRNRALNARRDARHHEPIPDDLDGVPQPPDVVLTGEELAAVIAAVRALPEAQREALVRSSVEGHTHEQIANALETTPGAARQLIYRARAAVRNGAGVLIPLPLVRAAIEAGPHHAEAAAGAGAGALAAGSLGGAGAGTAGGVKATTVVAVAVVAAGGGVALERASDVDPGRRVDLATPAVIGSDEGGAGSGARAESGAIDGDNSGPSENSGPGSVEDPGDDDANDRGDDSGPGENSGPSARSGPGGGGDDGVDADGNSGPGNAEDDREDNSGPGDSSGPSLSSGSGSSGSGSGDDDFEALDDDSSGSG
jgi:RNA polymerase sigma-70 factor (ECF subfamily)